MLNRLAAFALISFSGVAFTFPKADTMTAEQVLDAALARVKEARDPEKDFTFLVWEVSEKLNGEGEVAEKETALRRHIPVKNQSYRKLLEKNGRFLTAEEQRKESEREEKVRLEATCEVPVEGEEDEDKVEFNRELISRYDFELIGVEDVNGRPAHVVSFQPKSGKLPVNRRMDRALNNSQGRIWVDSETYEISKVDFEMDKPLRIWWGMIGSIQSVAGQIERSPIEDGVWLPSRFEFYINGRILFKKLHFRERVEWRDFQRLPTADIALAGCE